MSFVLPEIPHQTNRHFMDAVVKSAHEQEISLSDDIYNQNGVKLLSRGAKVSSETYSKVISHKLVKPIELCLSVDDAPSGEMLARTAEQVLDEFPLLADLCSWKHGRVTPLGMLKQCKMGEGASSLLAVAFAQNAHAPRHAVMTSLIAMGLCNAHRYNDPQMLVSLCLAGLFHDIGELYVDPKSIQSADHVLSAQQWQAYSSHPIIGAALAREVCRFDKTTQQAILEHHEYADGFGYPRNLCGKALSVAGRLASLSEVLAALVTKPSAESRIDVALKIMPGEHDPELVSLVYELLHGRQGAAVPPPPGQTSMAEDVHAVFMRIAAVLTVYDDIMLHRERLPPKVESALSDAFNRFVEIQKAFASTGINGLQGLEHAEDAEALLDIRLEAECVLNEIAWRLLKLSRELTLKAATLGEQEAETLLRLANALAGTEEVRHEAVVELF
jgi:HD-GYP domain-containing protein (c-di-GMP phosphodiesterase class II)